MGGAGSQGEGSLQSHSVPKAQAGPADKCAHLGTVSMPSKRLLHSRCGGGCVCHVKCKIQGAKGPAKCQRWTAR